MSEENVPSHATILNVERHMLNELNIPEILLDGYIDGHIIEIRNMKNESVTKLTDDSIYIFLIKETVKTIQDNHLHPEHVFSVGDDKYFTYYYNIDGEDDENIKINEICIGLKVWYQPCNKLHMGQWMEW